jgi:hypothetical protein
MLSIENFPYESHWRELAGLALLMGVVVIIQPFSDFTNLTSDGEKHDGTLSWIRVGGGLCLVTVGVMSVLVSYNTLVHNGHTDPFMKNLLVALLVGGHTGYIVYITGVRDYAAEKCSISFDVAMMASIVRFYEFVSVLALAGSFLFAMYDFINGTPKSPATSFRGRMFFYSFVVALVGFTQLLLGSYIQKNFADDSGKLEHGPICVPLYEVSCPAMNIIMGLLQTMFGAWGVNSSLQASVFMDYPFDKIFRIAMFGFWILQLVLQFITQIGVVAGTLYSCTAPTFFCLAVGLNLMPAYLDYKMRSLPEVIDKVEYYRFQPDAPAVATERLEHVPKNLHDDEDDDVESPTAKQHSDEGL